MSANSYGYCRYVRRLQEGFSRCALVKNRSWLPSLAFALALLPSSVILPSHAIWGVAYCQEDLPAAAAGQTPLANDSQALLSALQRATAEAIRLAEPSVVAIARVRTDRAPNAQANSLFLGGELSDPRSPGSLDYVPVFFGSGIIISSDGYIVTCAHVLDDPRRNDYFVWLNKRSYAAQVVSRSAKVLASSAFGDLAVLKIEAEGLRPIIFGDPGQLQKGQFVVALGNPDAIARDGRASATWGIISNLKRAAPLDQEKPAESTKGSIHHYGTLIQTDAIATMYASGGALVNLQGECVGLTTSLAARSSDAHPAGLAIACDSLFQRVVGTLRQGKLPEFGFLGIEPEDLRMDERRAGKTGARVGAVIQGFPGQRAGLLRGDVIYQVNDAPVDTRDALFHRLSAAQAGQRVVLFVRRSTPGVATPASINIPVSLGKKFVDQTGLSYATNTQPPWRGLQVDYSTAIPPELMRRALLGGRLGGPPTVLAAVDVQPGAEAWNAGIRPGDGIIDVNRHSYASPREFFRAMEAIAGAVTMRIRDSSNKLKTIRIEPAESEHPLR